jgi:hypothetical protein
MTDPFVVEWFDHPDTQRDIAAAKGRLLKAGSTVDPVLLVILTEILSALEWGMCDCATPEDEEDERWK